MKRSEQKVENTWRMEDLYASQEAYDADLNRLRAMMEAFAPYRGTLARSAGQLYEVLARREEMNELFESLYVYAMQKHHEDTQNPVYQKQSGAAQTLSAQLAQALSWVEPEILALPEETLDRYYREEPQLEDYRRVIEQITRMKAHILDAQTEALLSRAGEVTQAPSNIFSMFNNADIRFPAVTDSEGKQHTLTIGTFIPCMQSRDRVLRKNAFESLYSVYAQYQNTVAAMYQANVKQADFMAKERKYPNALEAALDANAVPVSVYHNLIQAVNESLPLMHRYMRLRKKLLGVEELHMYDVYVSAVDCPDRVYPFAEAKEIVKRGLEPLGADYLEILQEGFDSRWIDIYENEGKRTGAYSWGAYGTHPYVLLNYSGTLTNVFTLAHEMGHALHSWYSDHAQPFRYAGYRIFVAEVASTCNEALLIRHLLAGTEDPAKKCYLINYFLDQFKSTMYRQTMFAEFELETHAQVERGETLTAEALCSRYLELNRRYFGPDVVCDRAIAHEWERIPHFYRLFYVYQYATSFAAAVAISSKILAGEPGIVEKYKKFLSSGNSMDPIDLLKLCDVDMSTPEPLRRALAVFEEYLGELERLSGEL